MGVSDLLLLETKLFVARPRRDLIGRPRLLDRLDAALDSARCTLLSAPAGAGKTTLLAAWIDRLDRPVGWISLDERDQDTHQVLRYVIAALQSVAPSCGRAAQARLSVPPPPRAEVVLTSLINDMAALPRPCLLVLDDYHLVRAAGVHEALVFLVEHLPSAVHLVIATREDPPLPLPRLRARNQIAEVRAHDLRFTPEEAARFLTTTLGLRVSTDQVAALVERTEGWAAGLQLAGLALRDRADPSTFVAAFAQGHRLVADYLSAEVLDRQPPATRQFLLATSVLDRLCAPLCDALMVPDSVHSTTPTTGHSQVMLEDLERASLFLIPLDDAKGWYRYHHLFADALRSQLSRQCGISPSSLHHRAARWFAHEGLLPEAIEHALAGQAVDEAAEWIESLTPILFENAATRQSVRSWLDHLPDPVVRARPLLCLAQAWLSLDQLGLATSDRWIEAAEQALPGNDGEKARRARGAVATMQAFRASTGPTGAPERARGLAERALADLATEDAGYRSLASVTLGMAAVRQGQLDAAEQAYAAAAATARAGRLAHMTMVGTSHQLGVLRAVGARQRALAAAGSALGWASASGRSSGPGVGVVSAQQSDLLRDGNDLEAAVPLATAGLRAVREYGESPPLILVASLSLAWLRLARGELADAAAVLSEARPYLQAGPFAPLVVLLDACDAQVRLALGDLDAALAWSAEAPPFPMPAILGFGGHMLPVAVEAMSVAVPRILLARGLAFSDVGLLRQAGRALEPAWDLAQRLGLGWLRLRARMISALIADGLGDHEAALATLAEAVVEAQPEGYVRAFVDDGPPMAALLARLSASDGKASVPTRFLESLAAAFPRDTWARDAGARRADLVEPPSSRELDVLRLLVAGRSNHQIAQDLVLERSTVKTHLIHLYGKLGVHSRTQAIARARELHLLD